MPRLAYPKLMGERVECGFMHAALLRDFSVAKPFGDSMGYDVIVDSGGAYGKGRLWRVQVRTAMKKKEWGGYKVNATRGSKPKVPMTSRDADILAIWVGDYETWYLVPVELFAPTTVVCVYPDHKNSKGKWEAYREAWRLLRKE